MKRGLGTHRDLHDFRDVAYTLPTKLLKIRPATVDLREHMPPVYNQGKLNSCSANAIASVMWFVMRRDRLGDEHAPSRLFIYYNERAREGLVSTNSPVSMRDGYRSVAKRGACHERLWPYIETRFTRRPHPRCYANAHKHRAIRYMRIKSDLRHLQICLAEGFPITFGMTVYDSFMSDRVKKTGVLPLPKKHEKPIGGHAMTIAGYQNAEKRFIVRNSWGPRWGDAGYCYIPYEYMIDDRLAWDFWTVRRVSTRRHK